jgi:hypothetical protein
MISSPPQAYIPSEFPDVEPSSVDNGRLSAPPPRVIKNVLASYDSGAMKQYAALRGNKEGSFTMPDDKKISEAAKKYSDGFQLRLGVELTPEEAQRLKAHPLLTPEEVQVFGDDYEELQRFLKLKIMDRAKWDVIESESAVVRTTATISANSNAIAAQTAEALKG